MQTVIFHTTGLLPAHATGVIASDFPPCRRVSMNGDTTKNNSASGHGEWLGGQHNISWAVSQAMQHEADFCCHLMIW